MDLQKTKMNHSRRLFWLATFLLFAKEASSFSSVSGALPNLLQSRHITSPVKLYQATTPLYYRDERTNPDEKLAEAYSNANNPRASSSANANEASSLSSSSTDGVSMSLIRAIWFNQASIMIFATAFVTGISLLSGDSIDFNALHWNGSLNFHSFFDLGITPFRFLEGFLATLPLIALGSVVEKSDRRDASHVNFSTTNMVISLFGRRKSKDDPNATATIDVMLLSALVALSTGISEELVFRGYLPTALTSFTNSIPLAALVSTLLFAAAHVSPKSSMGENRVVGALQFSNGIWYSLVYLATGDLLPCIIAHMLYDMHVLCETWTVINHQMDYTQDAFQKESSSVDDETIARIQQQAGPSLSSETLNFAKRFFYAFDYEKQGSLSLPDVQRAVSYAFLKSKKIPEPERVEELFSDVLSSRMSADGSFPPNRLVVNEFLELLFTLKSRTSAP